MNIEFNAPVREVPEGIINDIKNKLTELHRKDKEISCAKVNFHKNHSGTEVDFTCEIELTIFGNSIMVGRNAPNYSLAAKAVLKEITEKVDLQIHQQKDLPEQLFTSVVV